MWKILLALCLLYCCYIPFCCQELGKQTRVEGVEALAQKPIVPGLSELKMKRFKPDKIQADKTCKTERPCVYRAVHWDTCFNQYIDLL